MISAVYKSRIKKLLTAMSGIKLLIRSRAMKFFHSSLISTYKKKREIKCGFVIKKNKHTPIIITILYTVKTEVALTFNMVLYF